VRRGVSSTFIAVKFAVSAALLYLATSRINLGMIADRLDQLHLSRLLAAVAIGFLQSASARYAGSRSISSVVPLCYQEREAREIASLGGGTLLDSAESFRLDCVTQWRWKLCSAELPEQLQLRLAKEIAKSEQR
jgi:hypothetical protein